MSEIYDLTMPAADGSEIAFADFRDQALLIVNLASQ